MLKPEALGGVFFIGVAVALILGRRPVSSFLTAWNGLVLPKFFARSTPSGVLLLATIPLFLGVLYLLHAFLVRAG